VDFQEIRRDLQQRKMAFEAHAKQIASARQSLLKQIRETSKWRFLKLRALRKDLAKAQRKATSANMDARFNSAVQHFEMRLTAAINAYETAFNNLYTASITTPPLPASVFVQKEHEFNKARMEYEKLLKEEEKTASEEFRKITDEYNKA